MRKRHFLALASLTAISGLAYVKRDPILKSVLENVIDNEALTISHNEVASCKMQTAQIEGPYRTESPMRSDIREDRSGAQFELGIQIVQENGCVPLDNALVEIWQCDAEGIYSGYPPETNRSISATLSAIDFSQENLHAKPSNDSSFLRGSQTTDQDGKVTFKTIIPGWYTGRAPHIHVKVYLSDQEQLTTQLYFASQLTDELYANHPLYKAYGESPFNHQNDFVIAQSKGAEGLIMPVTEDSGVYASDVRLVV